MKQKFAAAACMITACCLNGILCACAQDGSFDLQVTDLESRINVERDKLSDLRQRQAEAQRRKSLLLAEIEQETGRISKFNREIKPAPRSTEPVVRRKKTEPIPLRNVPSAPAPAECAPAPVNIDEESQAEIDRLVAMREKLIAERDSLEQIVKPAPGAP